MKKVFNEPIIEIESFEDVLMIEASDQTWDEFEEQNNGVINNP